VLHDLHAVGQEVVAVAVVAVMAGVDHVQERLVRLLADQVDERLATGIKYF
jgi:hypothetical protein